MTARQWAAQKRHGCATYKNGSVLYFFDQKPAQDCKEEVSVSRYANWLVDRKDRRVGLCIHNVNTLIEEMGGKREKLAEPNVLLSVIRRKINDGMLEKRRRLKKNEYRAYFDEVALINSLERDSYGYKFVLLS
jgi:hypothetical protein